MNRAISLSCHSQLVTAVTDKTEIRVNDLMGFSYIACVCGLPTLDISGPPSQTKTEGKMRSRICFSAFMVLAALRGLAGQEQPRTPVATPAVQQVGSAPAYRLLQLVSASNTEQAINDAAAGGYRFVMLQPTAGAGGVTVLMKRLEAGTSSYQYRLLLVEPGKDRLQRALNEAASGGFRLVANSLRFAPFESRGSEVLLWPSASTGKKNTPMIHLAVVEKLPGESAAYDYRVSSALRHSAAQSDLAAIARQGFTPVASTMELSESTAMALLAVPARLPRFVLVFEKNHGDAAPVRAQGQYVYVRIGERLSSGDPLTELTVEVPAEAVTAEAPAGNEPEKKAEPSEEPGAAPYGDDASRKPRLSTAAIVGSRVLSLTHFVYSDGVWLLAEKHAAKPPSYRLVLLADPVRLEDALNSAAREGFRLFPGGVVDTARRLDPLKGEVRDEKHRRQVLAVLQRDTAAAKYQYRIVHADDAVVLLKLMSDASAQGYAFAYMWETNVVMERALPESAGHGGGP